jgi:MFS family permease
MKNKFQMQIAFATAFNVLTSGVFLSGLAAMMGAGDVLIGYISIITNVCGALIIFFAPFIERFKSRKTVTLFLTVLSKITTVLIVFIPITVPKGLQLFFFVPLIVIAFSLQAQTLVSLNNWLVYFVEEEKRGRYISLRMTVQFIITVLLSIAAGRFIDSMEGTYSAFAILFGTAFLLALFEILTLIQIDDVQVSQDIKKTYTLKDSFLIPFQNKDFMGFVVYISLFYFLLYIAGSFNIVYMLKYLKLSYTEITLIEQLCMSLPMVFLFFLWGKASDKRGHTFVLHTCIWFFALELLFFMLASTETARIFLPIAFFFAAIANAGFNISMFNRRYELIPKEGRIIHDNFFHAAIGISLLLGPITGGTIKNIIAESGIVLGIQFGEFRALYALSFIGILLLQLLHSKKMNG